MLCSVLYNVNRLPFRERWRSGMCVLLAPFIGTNSSSTSITKKLIQGLQDENFRFQESICLNLLISDFNLLWKPIWASEASFLSKSKSVFAFFYHFFNSQAYFGFIKIESGMHTFILSISFNDFNSLHPVHQKNSLIVEFQALDLWHFKQKMNHLFGCFSLTLFEWWI